MIAIVDYGLGNIEAFVSIYNQLNIPANVVRRPEDLSEATRIILPGVGAFDGAMDRLQKSGMLDCLDVFVFKRKRPVLGICVGMQVMARSSEEGELPGLGWVDAEAKRFKAGTPSQKILLPHMGWNEVELKREDPLFKGLEVDSRFYFLHSYYVLPSSRVEVLAVTDYNGPFTSAFRFGNIYGIQFHPEKSHQWGVQLLKNFALI